MAEWRTGGLADWKRLQLVVGLQARTLCAYNYSLGLVDSDRDSGYFTGLLLAIYDRCECSVSLDYELDSIYCRLGKQQPRKLGRIISSRPRSFI